MKRFFAVFYTLFLFFSVSTLYSQSRTSLDFLNRILGQNNLNSAKSRQRIVSGRLLVTDDPAALAIYEKLKSHMNYLSVNIQNQNDLILYYQTRDGYLGEMVNALQRIRELVLRKSNGFYGMDDKEIIDSEIYLHYDGMAKTISRAQFNTKPLFASWMNEDLVQNRFEKADFYTIEGVDRILKSVVMERSRQGALINALGHRIKGEGVQRENSVKSYSQGDTDFAVELSNLQKSEILFFTNMFLLDVNK